MLRHKMDMSPEEIRVKLLLAKKSQASIAQKIGVSQPCINMVIEGRTVSHRVRQAIADTINTDIRIIWPSTYIIHGGSRKPGRPKTI